MKIFSLLASLLLLITTNSFAQSEHEKDSLRFVTSYTVTKQQINTISFEGTIDRKKALSAVLGKTRHFKVYAVRNPYNKGYHFDWQISETNNEIENQSFFFKENDFFEIQERARQINVLENVTKLEDQHEFEIIRSYLLPDELLYGLAELKQPTHVTFEDDGSHFKMYNQVADDLLRIVCYNKETLFPENTDLIKSHPNMSALDLTSIRLTNIKINEELPQTAISLKLYLNKGYKINLSEPVASIETQPKQQQQQQPVVIAPIVVAPSASATSAASATPAYSQINVNTLLKTKLETGKGWETTIGQFHDKSYLLLDFWFASSAHSMEDLPAVQSLHRDFRKKGLRVFGVNCRDFNQKKTVAKKLKQKGITFTTLFGMSSKLKKWGIQNVPTYVLLDKDGEILLQGSTEVLEEIRGYLNEVE